MKKHKRIIRATLTLFQRTTTKERVFMLIIASTTTTDTVHDILKT